MTNNSPFSPNRRQFIELLATGLALASLPASRAFAQASNLASMKIATIGAGREGGALGTLYAKLGHPVMFSSRHPEQLKDLVAAAGPTARAGTVADAVAFGDVIFLVVPYTAVEQIGRDFGAALAAKPLILDVSNPIPRRDGQEIVDKVASEGGPGLVTAKLLKGARVVRAFNAIGSGGLATNAHRSGENARHSHRRRRQGRDRPCQPPDPRRRVSSPCSSAVWRKANISSRERRSPANIRRRNFAKSRRH